MEQQLAETEHQEKADLQQLLDASNHQHNSLEKQARPKLLRLVIAVGHGEGSLVPCCAESRPAISKS